MSVFEHLQEKAEQGGRRQPAHAVADLMTIAFFFLLRVEEYTALRPGLHTRTVKFWIGEVTFYKGGWVIPNDAPLDTLLQAGGVALCIDNQKNDTHGETIHHHALPGRRVCPACDLA